jgi:guanine nucleotide-binding protein alpha-1 subunit
MNAIIFLAPISCFDQVLVEDPTVNRLVSAFHYVHPANDDSLLSLEADSVQLWTSIISNKLLADTPIVLFLNKCDLLQAKIEAGARFAKHIISYGERPNTFEGCRNCECACSTNPVCVMTAPTSHSDLRKKFMGIHKERSPKPRQFHCHFTSVTVGHHILSPLCFFETFPCLLTGQHHR